MNLKCPNLIAIHDMRTTEDGDSFVVMEYVSGPSLANLLTDRPHGLPLPELRAWLKGMVDGVAYLHDHGIVHRDLKPANMFMEEGVVKIGDYGLSKSITLSQDRGHSESIGTCHYMAPEISSGKYHKPIDIYALGVVLYEMLTGRVPFEGETVQEVLMKHLTSRPDLTGLPEPYRSLVARALAKESEPPADQSLRTSRRRRSSARLYDPDAPSDTKPSNAENDGILRMARRNRFSTSARTRCRRDRAVAPVFGRFGRHTASDRLRFGAMSLPRPRGDNNRLRRPCRRLRRRWPEPANAPPSCRYRCSPPRLWHCSHRSRPAGFSFRRATPFPTSFGSAWRVCWRPGAS